MKTETKTELRKRPRRAFVPPATCLACSARAGYRVVRVTKDVAFKGEVLPVTYECSECSNCGDQILSPAQMDARLRATVAAFQRRHDLMTAREVIDQRRSLGFASQQEIVSACPVISIATLKRVEAGRHAQDPSTDFILRKAFGDLEGQRLVTEISALLSRPLPEPAGQETLAAGGTVVGASGWQVICRATMPLAACVSIVATAVSCPEVNIAEAVPVEVAQGC